MNSNFHKLQQQHQQEEQLAHAASQNLTTKGEAEFETVEDLIRHDSSQVEVPPEIAIRLNESIAAEPKATKPWFKKIFSS